MRQSAISRYLFLRMVMVMAWLMWGLPQAVTQTASAQDPTASPRIEASIVFDRVPVEKGLTFVRKGVSPEILEIEGQPVEVWRVKAGTAPKAQWLRSMYLTFTDDRFRHGAMPAVDIEVEYVHRTQTSVDIMADTERGSVRVGSRWGASPKMRTIRATVDDAWFGARPHEGKGDAVDGFDLRLNAANEDWFIRSITVRGYDLNVSPNLPRLIRLTEVKADDRPIFLYQQRESGRLTYQVRNIAQIPVRTRAIFQLRDRGGHTLTEHQREVTLAPSSRSEFTFDFKTEQLPYGVYDTEFRLLTGDDAPPLAGAPGNDRRAQQCRIAQGKRRRISLWAGPIPGHAAST